MKKKIILIGGGGHAESIIDSIYTTKQYKITGILDNYKEPDISIYGIKIIGTDKDLAYYFQTGIRYAAIGIGSIGHPDTRQKLFKECKRIGYMLPNIIDKTAVLPKNIKLGQGNFIGKGVIVNSNVAIGNACILNTGSIIEHNCILEDFVHIAPGSTLCGNVRIESYTHIGAHSVILQNRRIGSNTMIGAGSIVITDISQNQLAYGNPAKEVRSFE